MVMASTEVAGGMLAEDKGGVSDVPGPAVTVMYPDCCCA